MEETKVEEGLMTGKMKRIRGDRILLETNYRWTPKVRVTTQELQR